MIEQDIHKDIHTDTYRPKDIHLDIKKYKRTDIYKHIQTHTLNTDIYRYTAYIQTCIAYTASYTYRHTYLQTYMFQKLCFVVHEVENFHGTYILPFKKVNKKNKHMF